ncbi:M23 family metallopeptidase [Thiohalophilus sp.]|uniref:M23 family metallopeptidase n=1 Tax=Thiohalophilus sp. TaxID=3028392 RepID=UPI003982EFE7
MNIVVLRRNKGSSGLLTLTRHRLISLVLGTVIVLPAAFIGAGYYLGVAHMKANPDDLNLALQSELDAQRLKIEEVTRNAQENMDALALRLGNLQSHVVRLDALGQRLTQMANLDNGEFNFEQPPAQGGPLSNSDDMAGSSMNVPDFLQSLQELSSQIEDRSQQLGVLEDMLMTRNLQAEVVPAGRPITRGWLSSYYGMRTDPFSGRRAHHSGIDFAGKEGSDVVAVAAGVVTYSGKRSGYGRLVEVNHGKGYVTRYGHNKEHLVEVGDTVKKGQVIARMGSSGRSTGPHVHFEVLVNGRAVDPKKYILASK